MLGEWKPLTRGWRSFGIVEGWRFSQEETFSSEALIPDAKDVKNLEIVAVPGKLNDAFGPLAAVVEFVPVALLSTLRRLRETFLDHTFPGRTSSLLLEGIWRWSYESFWR